MSDKSLKDKAIQIQGKDYVLVADRIIYFNEQYPNGSITTELISDPESDQVIVKATILPVAEEVRTFTGYSQAVKGAGFINKTAALENAETSAVGRALAMMGIGVIDSIASADEINKAKGTDGDLAKKKAEVVKLLRDNGITDSQDMLRHIESVIQKPSIDSVSEAKKVLESLSETDDPTE